MLWFKKEKLFSLKCQCSLDAIWWLLMGYYSFVLLRTGFPFPQLDQEDGQYIESYRTDKNITTTLKNITTKLNESYKVLLHHFENTDH